MGDATFQQAAGLHPFVTKITIVNPAMYPEIVQKAPKTEEWCSPAITDDFNMYTVTVSTNEDNTKTLSILKIQRQDYHEHYFTAEIATTTSPVGFSPVQKIVNMNEYNLYPVLLYSRATTRLYLLYNTLTGYTLCSYLLNNNGYSDLTAYWEHEIGTAPNTIQQHGLLFNGTTVYVYTLQATAINVFQFDKVNGAELPTFQIAVDQQYTYCKLVSSIEHDEIFYVMVRTGDIIRLATYNMNTSLLSAFVQLTTSNGGGSSPTEPGLFPFITAPPSDMTQMCAGVYGFNNDTNNIIQIAYVKHIINGDGGIVGLETPFLYNINKFQLFSEISNPSQNDMVVAVASNPNNPNFSYIAYVAGTSQLRVVKVYRNKLASTYETHSPLVMWATRLGAIGDTFQGSVSIVPDSLGNIYVFTRSPNPEGEIMVWKIREYIIDLGHTEGTVVSPVDTLTNMLQTMTNEYTILTAAPNIHVAAFPNINDVTVDSVDNIDDNISIKFKYINYDYLQAFKSVVAEIKTLVNNTFVTLYQDSALTVINLDPNDASVGGDDASIDVIMPLGTAKKPCVVRGTQVIKAHATGPILTNIENIEVGDSLINHLGKPVKVLDHLISTVYAQEHNAPYLIPVNFFGKNRPYKQLLISGDHGILVTGGWGNGNTKVVYPETITVLKQVLHHQTVEYHHLLLENHTENFFIANGLEVDSYHPGVFLKSRT